MPDCDIQLDDLRVSRHHCIIERRDAKFVVRDLGSTSGTYVNGSHVKGEVALKSGDEIAIGASRIRFDEIEMDHFGNAPPPPRPPPLRGEPSFQSAPLARGFGPPPMMGGGNAARSDFVYPLPMSGPPPPALKDVGAPARRPDPVVPNRNYTYHLNTWFPDEPNADVYLPVGKPARLCVNLGPPHIPSGAGNISPLNAAALAELAKEGAVDVLVLCPGARVKPLRKRIVLPPDPKIVLEFTLTPLRSGKLDLQIVLLIKNEPIHRTSFPIEAFMTGGTLILGDGA